MNARVRDVEELNSQPINIKAKKMLEQVGEELEPSSLYAVQLAWWGINKGGLTTEVSVAETIEAMLAWRPARLMNFFMLTRDGNFHISGWEETNNPRELAQLLLVEIEKKVFLYFPGYFSID